MSIQRTRGRQRRALRSPFLLAVIAVVLGAVGFTQFRTPLSSFALITSRTATPATAAEVSSPVATLATAVARPTQSRTWTAIPPSPSSTATQTTAPPSSTATVSPSATATLVASATLTQIATTAATATLSATAVISLTVSPTAILTGTAQADSQPTPAPSPTPEATPTLRTARVPILMYHHVGDLPPDADAVRKSLTVSQANFQAQLDYLARQGYTTLRIADLINALHTGAPLPDKPIILTFDDGYDDAYLNVYPTLKDYHFVGTFFIIGAPTNYGSPGYVRWEQILEMYNNGMEIGAHSLTHRYNLGATRNSTQDVEIKQGHQLMVDHLPDWTPIFSYPSGSYNQYSLDLLESLGYIAAVTTKQGALQKSDEPLELRRIRVRGEWGIKQFVYWFSYWSNRSE